jgi:bifunctional UDP-N-acetylglucosamine pyrophosphorylase/glucosamine-1-phosphate N-acetyltransferase
MKSDTHKVLHPIAGRPMLEHLLASAAQLNPRVRWWWRAMGANSWKRRWAAGRKSPCRNRSWAPAMRCRWRDGLSGFDGDVLILYGDVPLCAETMRAMIERLNADDKPAVVVLGFEPEDALQYGRVIAQDGRISKMVEFKDASAQERATRLCNSGLMAVKAGELFGLLARVGNDNAQGEYYLTDIVNIANGDGRICAAVVTDDEDEVAGINSRGELAQAEAAGRIAAGPRPWPMAPR